MHQLHQIARHGQEIERHTNKDFFTSEYDSSVVSQQFSLDCKGAVGDMIYMTDQDLSAATGGYAGHAIAEVEIFSSEFS